MVSKTVRFAKNRRIVGVTAAARYAGVSRWTMHAWIVGGKIPFIRYPGTKDPDETLRGVKIDLADLDLLIDRARDRNEGPRRLTPQEIFKNYRDRK